MRSSSNQSIDTLVGCSEQLFLLANAIDSGSGESVLRSLYLLNWSGKRKTGNSGIALPDCFRDWVWSFTNVKVRQVMKKALWRMQYWKAETKGLPWSQRSGKQMTVFRTESSGKRSEPKHKQRRKRPLVKLSAFYAVTPASPSAQTTQSRSCHPDNTHPRKLGFDTQYSLL